MALFPAPPILCYLPGINNITHKIQGLAGVVLEKVVELVSLAVSCAKMYIADKY
jgi:hypothetical protein